MSSAIDVKAAHAKLLKEIQQLKEVIRGKAAMAKHLQATIDHLNSLAEKENNKE